MAFVVADQQGWLDPAAATEPFNRFESLQNFKAMRDAVNGEQADFFMWETFMTKPYHDSGELKRLGEITPPWPAFSIAARRDLIARKGEDLRRALAAVDQATALFVAERDGRSVDLVVERLGHDREDVRSWFKTVSYPAKSVGVSRAALEVTLETLRKAGVVEREVVVEELVDTSVARLDA
ncbi:hypothetical protein BC936DRAFT_148496 [Jimgerdemannia flammicorona]|uniref:Ca3427-like PBP 2 domain-containing protein n=2 Tax=Jimgerdemannia flammicorona TaxID=994334 RepID=A0A433D2W8_9FUNG|nr:hypothetical protein BC936DRAFT_148496 [Jimgerdemannia flammicorona]